MNSKLDKLNLNNNELKSMLKLAKQVKNDIGLRIKELDPKFFGLCILIYLAIPKCNCYPGSYVEYFKELFPIERYDSNGNPLNDGTYRFAINKSEEDLIKGFYHYRLIWLNQLIEILENKIKNKK